MKIVMGLSGGMDSATLSGVLLDEGYEVHCCIFHYGATHGSYEANAAHRVISYFHTFYSGKVHKHHIDITPVMSEFSSNLLKACEGEIPEGHYNHENMKKTVVPGRNLIFTSILAGLAESIGVGKVALGIHSGDYHIYPDCRKEFAKALDTTIYLSTDKNVELIAPFANDDKTSILRKGYKLKVIAPYHLTRTCYKNQELSCGKCGSCRERLEAFEKIGIQDPVKYERRDINEHSKD